MDRYDIISLISHEIKTPISTITGYADIIRNNMVDSLAIARYADNIYSEAMRMGKLMDDMVYILKYNNNDLFPELYNKNIKKIVQKAIDKVEAQYGDAYNPIIEVTGTATSMVDEYMLEEVLFKLLENAILYGNNQYDEDTLHSSTNISIDLSTVGTKAKIVVRDNGIGMSKEGLEKACDLFYREDKKYSRSIGCNGMGLPVVKVIIAAHGGEFEMDSKEGDGTTVTVVI